MEKKIINFIFGFTIMFAFYFISLIIVKSLHIFFPPVIFALILFTIALIKGIIKEEWVKYTAIFLLKNMPILFVPFIVGLVAYKTLILQNLLTIILVILISTIITILFTGLFVEFGIKYLRLYKIRRKRD